MNNGYVRAKSQQSGDFRRNRRKCRWLKPNLIVNSRFFKQENAKQQPPADPMARPAPGRTDVPRVSCCACPVLVDPARQQPGQSHRSCTGQRLDNRRNLSAVLDRDLVSLVCRKPANPHKTLGMRHTGRPNVCQGPRDREEHLAPLVRLDQGRPQSGTNSRQAI